jgi:Flp pilus assembly protein TadG
MDANSKRRIATGNVGRLGLAQSPRFFRRQSGQALIELAFIVPLLLLVGLGVIEIGRYAYIGILVGNAARAGAAYAAQGLTTSGDTTGIQQAANRDFQSNGQNVSDLNVTSTLTCGCDTSGTVSPDTNGACFPSTPPTCTGHWVVTVHVTASGTFNALFNYPGIPSSLSVSRTASMRAAIN